MTSLTCLATLRGHKGDIRSVEFSRDGKYIFSAGQGGMLIWDLRNTDQPIELVEKKEDIFALKTTKNMMFMGCRNHSIIPMMM
jgi:WD40 repeat protein